MPQTKPAKQDAAAPIEIFRSGQFVDEHGRKVAFDAARIARTAAIYDPKLKAAPIVRGHKIDSATPAAGWIASLDYDAKADRLRATPEKIALSFAEEVARGDWRYVSAAYYLPDMKNNPVPGEYYLHHVAVLGATAPAVAGLAPLSFAASDDGELLVFTAPIAGFAEGAWREISLLRLLRSVKNLLIEKFSAEDADKALPESELAWLQEEFARADERARNADRPKLAFAQPTEETDVTDKTEDADALAKRLAEKDAALAAKDKQLAVLSFAEHTRYAESLVAARKLPSASAPIVAALLARVAQEDAEAPLAFSETIDGKSVETKLSATAALKRVLDGLPEMVAGGEAAARKDAAVNAAPAAFAAPAGYAVDPEAAALFAKASDYAKKHNVELVEAAKAVGAR